VHLKRKEDATANESGNGQVGPENVPALRSRDVLEVRAGNFEEEKADHLENGIKIFRCVQKSRQGEKKRQREALVLYQNHCLSHLPLVTLLGKEELMLEL
jgi:hypothetical protein